MNILFLGSLYPKEREQEIQRRSRYFDFAANTLQWALLEGLDLYANVTVITVPATKCLKGLFFKGSSFSHNSVVEDVCVSYCDIAGIKQLTAPHVVIKSVKREKNKFDVIFIYALTTELLTAAKYLKSKNPSLKVVLLVPDLPEYMTSSNNKLYRYFKSVEAKLNKKQLNSVHAFILLAEPMKERLAIGNKPYIVMEGIFNTEGFNSQIIEKEQQKTILYTGNLGKRYGIIDLLDAFVLINNSEYRLLIYGEGEALSDIISYSRKDARIIYGGVLPRQELLYLQKKSTLLVNPRHNNEEYTRYSFPSKTMEYMASGTPTLMYRLSCMPQEYEKYIYFFEDETVEGMSRRMVEVCEKPQEELNEFGRQASEFILKNKTSREQCKRIINLIEKL